MEYKLIRINLFHSWGGQDNPSGQVRTEEASLRTEAAVLAAERIRSVYMPAPGM